MTVPCPSGCVPWFLHCHGSASVPEPSRGWCAAETRGAMAAPTRARPSGASHPAHMRVLLWSHVGVSCSHHPLSTQSHTPETGPQAHRFPKAADLTEALVVRCWRLRIRNSGCDGGVVVSRRRFVDSGTSRPHWFCGRWRPVSALAPGAGRRAAPHHGHFARIGANPQLECGAQS